MPVYVAKPEAVVSPPTWPDVPVGWTDGWSWPGPNPPGYSMPDDEYEAAVSLTAGSTVRPGESVAASSLWMSAGLDGPMGLPDGEWEQQWSATIDGSPVGIKKSGDSSFSESITFPYSVVGSYYGAEDDIQFDVSEDNDGDTITLRVDTLVAGTEYSRTAAIVVDAETENTNYLKMTFSRVDVYKAEGVLVVSCPGGSVTFESVSNSVTSATGVFTQTGAKEVTVSAENLTIISGSTLSGSYSSSSISSLQTNPRSTASVQLYNEAGISIIGESASKQFSLILPPYGEDSMSADICSVTEDEVTQL